MLVVNCRRKFYFEEDFSVCEWRFDFGRIWNWHYANVIVDRERNRRARCAVDWCSVFDDVNEEYYEYDFDRECFERK